MATTLDTLNIKITSDASSAAQAIDKLTRSLQNLNKQLGLKDGTQLSKTLQSIASAANGVSGAITSINTKGLDDLEKKSASTGKALNQLKKDGEDLKTVLEGLHTPDIDKAMGIGNLKTGVEGGKIVERGFIIPNFDDSAPTRVAETVRQKLLPAVVDTERESKELQQTLAAFTFPDFGTDETIENLGNNAEKTTSKVKELVDAMNHYKDIIRIIEAGGYQDNAFTDKAYAEAVKGYSEASKKLNDFKKAATGEQPTIMTELTPRLIELSEAFERLAGRFGKLADGGTKLFKTLIKPLELASHEYVEKFEHMKASVDGFVKHVQQKMTKLSQFWKRTMKTFTFMLVRKAITAIIKEVGTAIQSLALFSNAMGTQFNSSISTLVADFQYLGRSIVSAFAPIIDAVAPVIDMLTDKIAELISYIGMLFAALTGADSFTKAKKTVDNYAESLDDANKSAKKLTMGIDELNILNENSSSSNKAYDGWEDAWEQVDVPDNIKKVSDKIKKALSDLFSPIKEAWASTKDYVLQGWDYMTDEMKKLLSDVWRDFLEVWKSDTVVNIFKNIFTIIGDIEISIGNLAGKFREAWNEGDKGREIFQNIAEVVDILFEHIQNVTEYMKSWSSQVDFNPFLESITILTDKFKLLADFLGGVFEDVMQNIVLKYIQFLIEEGIPHLNETIAEIINAFDFDDLRAKLQPVEEAFEQFLEAIDIGKNNALKNLGTQLAEFTKSEEFEAFLKTIEHMLETIDKDVVEKLLTGIGQAIFDLGQILVKFVGSETFNNFIDMIGKWFEEHSAEDIAKLLEKLAFAIGLFKFAQFATEGFAGFLSFAATIKNFQDIGHITKEIGKLSGALSGAGTAGAAAGAGGSAAATGLGAIAAPAAIVVAVIAAIVTVFYSLVKSYGGIDEVFKEFKKRIEKVVEVLAIFAKALGIDKAFEQLKIQVKRLIDALGNLKSLWDIILTVVQVVASVFGATLLPAIRLIIDTMTSFINKVATAIDVLGGLSDVVVSFFKGDWDGVKEGGERIANAIKEGFLGATVGLKEEVKKTVEEMPQELEPSIEKAHGGISGSFASSYEKEISNTSSKLKDATKGAYESGLSAVNDVDYSKYASYYNTEQYQAMMNSAKATDYSSYGTTVNDMIGQSLVASVPPILKSNQETAKQGATAYTETYSNYFKNDTTVPTSLYEYGKTSGEELGNGLNETITNNQRKSQLAINEWIYSIKTHLIKKLDEVKKIYNEKVTNILSGKEMNAKGAIDTFFANVTALIAGHLVTLGKSLLNTVLPNFMKTYIQPFFTTSKWKPYFDELQSKVFETNFQTFRKWFQTASNNWWRTDVTPLFLTSRWSALIIPIIQLAKQNVTSFNTFWKNTISNWWNNDVLPYFVQSRWSTMFNAIASTAQQSFSNVYLTINTYINRASYAVSDACYEMRRSLWDVLDTINDVASALSDLDANVTLEAYMPQFAAGGFPSAGLFMAGEAGVEMVGTVGGRAAVASNQEITGIADAVYATGNQESQFLAQLVTLAQEILDKDPVVLSDKEVALMTKRGNSKLGMDIIS